MADPAHRRVFADEKGVKQRSGVLVSSAAYDRSRREAVLAAITSHVSRSWKA